MPDGISIGDGFFILFVTIAFVASLLFAVMMGIGLAAHIIDAFTHIRRLTMRLGRGFQVSALVAVSLFYLSSFLLLAWNTPDGLLLLVFAIGCGAVLLILFWVKYSNESRSNKKVLYFCTLIASVVLLAASLTPWFQDRVMRSVGIESLPGQMILVDEEDHDRLIELLGQSKIDGIIFCEFKQTKQWGTTNALVVWNGVGATSYVRLTGQVKSADKKEGRSNGKGNVPAPSASAASGSASAASTSSQEQPSAGNTSPADKTGENTITVPIPSKNLMVIRSTNPIPCDSSSQQGQHAPP